MTATSRAWGLRHAPDRIVVLGALAVRCVPYLTESRNASMPIAGLSLVCREFNETPIYHTQTGVYGWLRLPPGDHVVEIRDPSRFRLDRRLQVTVPDRNLYYEQLQAGVEAPPVIPPAMVDVPLRPAIGHPWSSGRTVLQGVVRTLAGVPLPFARLDIETVLDGSPTRVVTHADAQGEYAAHLPGEAVHFHMPDLDAGEDEDDAELIADFSRLVRVYRLTQTQVALVGPPYGPTNGSTSQGPSRPLLAHPLDFDTLDPDLPGSPYERPTSVVARTPAGDISSADYSVTVPCTAGQIRRIDFILS